MLLKGRVLANGVGIFLMLPNTHSISFHVKQWLERHQARSNLKVFFVMFLGGFQQDGDGWHVVLLQLSTLLYIAALMKPIMFFFSWDGCKCITDDLDLVLVSQDHTGGAKTC